MLVPATYSTGMWCSSNHFRTPMCASPMAPPPSSATPVLGRGRDEGFCCGRKGHGSRRNTKMKTTRRMRPPQWCVKIAQSQMFNEFGAAWRFQQARKEDSGTLVFLKDIASIDHQDLSGDVGSPG